MGAIEKAIAISEFEHLGVKCKVLVGPIGGLNGYCKVPTEIKIDTRKIERHGGITYEMDADRWIGFDCCHAGDGNFKGVRWVPNANRGQDFVEGECRAIAEQLRQVGAVLN